jgi:outer membrane lipase/esterase
MGLAIGASESDGSFARSLGSFKTRETVFSLFGTMKWNGLYGSAIASISDVNFRDMRRNIGLGAMMRTAGANAGGSNASALLSLGYDFSVGRFRVGPLVSVSAQNVEVNGFDESGANSSNLRVSGQKRRSEVWSAGVRASMSLGAWTPWLRVTADTERRDEVRFVSAAPLSMATGGSFDVAIAAPDKDFMTGAIGIHGLLMDRLGLSVSYYKVSGRSGIKEDGVGALLSYRF